MAEPDEISVLIPAFNEEDSIGKLIEEIRLAGNWLEIVVVDDASSDRTVHVAQAAGARVVRHPYNKGNGATVKSAVREARGEFVLLMDADGQHDPKDVQKLIHPLGEYDLVVGSRSWGAQATLPRGFGNLLLARLASFLCGIRIPDLTSGFRAARRDRLREFLHLLPNGFSYPTTSTMAFVRAGYNLCFVPIDGKQRINESRSKMRPWREGARFLVIILRMITLFSPLRVFLPISALFFLLGFGYLAYTIATEMHVTNTSVLLLTASAVLFLFGLLSEQIAYLRFQPPPTVSRVEPQRAREAPVRAPTKH
jgi:glycosyltransferase involved in cell wall biosynthesis